jgi:Flp pilus assembly protein TadD
MLTQAAALVVHVAATQNNLGLSHFDEGEFHDAVSCFEKAKVAEES